MRKRLLSAAIFATASISVAHAAPVYIGLQESGVNGGAITQEAGDGTASSVSITNLVYGTSPSNKFEATVTGTGTPPNPEPNLVSTAVDLTSQASITFDIYVSELNQNAVVGTSKGFVSTFKLNTITGTGASVTESTYVTECTGTGASSCTGQLWGKGILVSQQTLTAAGTIVTDYSSIPAGLTTDPYVVTELYAVTLPSDGTSNAEIDFNATPLPAALPLFATGLGAFGLLGWRRKRKAAALAA
jgi:hypothetical protein